jgi:hypothetical protein
MPSLTPPALEDRDNFLLTIVLVSGSDQNDLNVREPFENSRRACHSADDMAF